MDEVTSDSSGGKSKTYHLKWSSHIPNLETVFTTLLESESLSDVTLVCSDGTIKSHRLLLASCSNYFLRVFLETPTKKPMVVVPEISTHTMKNLLAFIYTGEVRVVEDILENLISAATMLQIRGLATGTDSEPQADALDMEVINDHAPKMVKSPLAEGSPLEKISPKRNEDHKRPYLEDRHLGQKSEHYSPTRKIEFPMSKRSRASPISSPVPDVFILPVLAPKLERQGAGIDHEEAEDRSHPLESKASGFLSDDLLDLQHQQQHHALLASQQAAMVSQSSQILSPSPNGGLGSLENMYTHFLQGKTTPPALSDLPAGSQNSPGKGAGGNSNVASVANLSIQQEEIARLMSQVTAPVCPICQKDCANFPNLRSHLQIHVNIKPFVCEFCDAKFSRASHLCRHRRTHTGEKPYECKKCGKLFSRQDKLKTHMDRHIAKEDIPLNGMGAPSHRRSKGNSKAAIAQQQARVGDFGVQNFSSLPLHPLPPHSGAQPQAPVWNNNAFPGINPYCLPPPPGSGHGHDSNPGGPSHHQVVFPGQPVQHMISDRNAIMASIMKMS